MIFPKTAQQPGPGKSALKNFGGMTDFYRQETFAMISTLRVFK